MQERRWDISVPIAMLMVTFQHIELHIELNYFHGSYLVVQHLRASLLRKYLSLSARDHQRWPHLEHHFRVAITRTAEEVRRLASEGAIPCDEGSTQQLAPTSV